MTGLSLNKLDRQSGATSTLCEMLRLCLTKSAKLNNSSKSAESVTKNTTSSEIIYASERRTLPGHTAACTIGWISGRISTRSYGYENGGRLQLGFWVQFLTSDNFALSALCLRQKYWVCSVHRGSDVLSPFIFVAKIRNAKNRFTDASLDFSTIQLARKSDLTTYRGMPMSSNPLLIRL